METRETLSLLQLLFAGTIAEAAATFEQNGLLEQVTERRRREELLSAPGRLQQLNLRTPEEVFEFHAELLGFCRWQLETDGQGLRARATSCKLCTIARALQAPRPCLLACANPLTALCGALEPSRRLAVTGTLWESNECTLVIQL